MLPIGTEPLILDDGTQIDPMDGSIIPTQEVGLTEVPSHTEIQKSIVVARKRISELPLPPKQMNIMSVIIGYTLFGINDEDIATLISVTPEQLGNIKSSDAYIEVRDTFVNNIIDSDSDNVRSLFSQQSIVAANKITSLLNSDSASVSMMAAKDVLDRAGHRPADTINHKHTLEGGLTIRYVKRQTEEVAPMIDITPDGESL